MNLMKFIKIMSIMCLFFWLYASMAQASPVHVAKPIEKIRISWEPIPNAVWYNLVVVQKTAKNKTKVVFTKQKITTNGYEIDGAVLPNESYQLFWQVQGVNYQEKPISEFTISKPVSNEEVNPHSPRLTSQAEQLTYAKVYPVYSWVPVAKADSYEVQVFFDSSQDAAWQTASLVKTLPVHDGNAWFLYDWEGFVAEGSYWWRVRAKDQQLAPIGDWSAVKKFNVVHSGIKIASFGDSITHGGGAVNNPPSYTLYDWQTYTGLSILNLGCSGDTTKQLNKRFTKDVIPFAPKILVIMGGINDVRLGIHATSIISELNKLKFRCLLQGIQPVFVTLTPLNPIAMRQVLQINPADGWENEREKVNEWIRGQQYFVDVAAKLATPNGWYLPGLSTDGLHPDANGKELIGSAIGEYLRENFSPGWLQ